MLRQAYIADMDAAIDDLERALRECPDDLWEQSVWRVSKTDPWMWPRAGVDPNPERTEEALQRMSHFWVIAFHCLFFLDFYVTTDMDSFRTPDAVKGNPEEMDWPPDGAAPIPGDAIPRDVLLDYLGHGRRRLHDAVTSTGDEGLAEPLPAGHPHAGKTLEQLLQVNLDHVREHGGDLLAYVERGGGLKP